MRGGVSRICVWIFLFPSAELIRRRIIRLFRKITVWEKHMLHWTVSQFSVEDFQSQSAKKDNGEPFNVSDFFWFGKKLWMKGGGFITYLCLEVLKKCRGEPFYVSKKLGFWELLRILMGITTFDQFSCLTYRKRSLGTIVFSENFWNGNLLWIRGGVSRFCVKNFFCLTVPKTFFGKLSFFQKIFRMGKFYG